ncbi:MAG: hypothetical protein JJD92_16135 [Frankiaceae bacterium]|nr:hypothetical protein [Frankiaceae bacterium]
MRPLPPVRQRAETLGWWLVTAAGAIAVLSAMLPWVQVPVGFEQLRVRGISRPVGGAVLVVGIALLLLVGYAARRPGLAFPVRIVAEVAVALGVAAVVGWMDVQDLLTKDQPGLGVHPGHVGPGIRLVGVAAAILLIAAGYVRRALVRTRADASERDGAHDE